MRLLEKRRKAKPCLSRERWLEMTSHFEILPQLCPGSGFLCVKVCVFCGHCLLKWIHGAFVGKSSLLDREGRKEEVRA